MWIFRGIFGNLSSSRTVKGTRERRRISIIWKAFFWTLLFRLLPEGSSGIQIMSRSSRSSQQRRSGRGQSGVRARQGSSGDRSVAVLPRSEFMYDDAVTSGVVRGSLETSLDHSDDEAAAAEAEDDARQYSGPDYDGGEDLGWYSGAGSEAAYCQAATESYNASIDDGVPGGSEAVPTPFKGQGSAMYSYHECGKMRVGTLNIRGSLRGATEVCAVG